MHASSLMAETYRVPATAKTVTLGLFTLNKTPVVKIHSGDTVSMETWNSCLHEMVFNKTTPANVAEFYRNTTSKKDAACIASQDLFILKEQNQGMC